jgi:prevent-host-death family protein
MFTLRLAELAREHLAELRPFHRNRILDAIDAQLTSKPTVETARRKVLVGATPSFEHVQPVWQLRVGDFRVIYDVDGRDRVVTVRAVLPQGQQDDGRDSMKVLAMRDAKTGLSATLDEAQHDRVLITRNGKPSALVIGVEGRDFEDVLLMSNPRFWEMIEASRRNPKTYSMEEVRAYFARKDAKEAAAPRAPVRGKSRDKAPQPASTQPRGARRRARG